MTGSWGVYRDGQRWRRSPRRAWLVLRARGHEVVEFDGPVLELMTEARTRFDPRLAALGPDVLADPFDADALPAPAARATTPRAASATPCSTSASSPGIGNMWKAEGCWGASVDPWRPVREVTDAEALAVRRGDPAAHARRGASRGRASTTATASTTAPAGRARRCGALVRARGQGDDNRTTFWCPGCQS